MIDDDELDQEVSAINAKADTKSHHSLGEKSSISSKDSCHIVNEVPEGRLSKKSSRSSQSSVCSNSTRESSNIMADFSDNASCNTDAVDSINTDADTDGCKNEVLDTLMRKFNLNVDNSGGNAGAVSNNNDNKNVNKNQNQIKIANDDQKQRKISDLQKKIHRNQMIRQNNLENSFDSDVNNSLKVNQEVLKRNLKLREIKISSLPQSFQCKYIGKIRCQGLWGVRYTREPIDRLVAAAKCLPSVDDLPTMETLISEKGIYIVQKQNPSKSKKTREKIYRSGLIPISNISYGVQDNKYGKIFSCIVVREREGKTLCECYAFLNSKAQTARKMALSLTMAFKEYGKLLQIKESNIRQTILLEEAKTKELIRDSVV